MDSKAAVFTALVVATAFLLFQMGPVESSKDLYLQWKNKLNVNFDEKEDMYRFKIFEQNFAEINAHNSKLGRSHTEGLNQFCFMTKDEFKANYLSTSEQVK